MTPETVVKAPDTQYQKEHAAVRNFLLGREYHKAVHALDFAGNHHKGMRRNGSHEFSHQLGVVRVVRALPDVEALEQDLIMVAILHDVVEDYEIPDAVIRAEFGDQIHEYVYALTKIRNGVKIPDGIYYGGFEASPVCALVKGADRCNNLLTASGAFKKEKMAIYLKETEDFVLPTLRACQRRCLNLTRAFDCERIMLQLAMTGFGFRPVDP